MNDQSPYYFNPFLSEAVYNRHVISKTNMKLRPRTDGVKSIMGGYGVWPWGSWVTVRLKRDSWDALLLTLCTLSLPPCICLGRIALWIRVRRCVHLRVWHRERLRVTPCVCSSHWPCTMNEAQCTLSLTLCMYSSQRLVRKRINVFSPRLRLIRSEQNRPWIPTVHIASSFRSLPVM